MFVVGAVLDVFDAIPAANITVFMGDSYGASRRACRSSEAHSPSGRGGMRAESWCSIFPGGLAGRCGGYWGDGRRRLFLVNEAVQTEGIAPACGDEHGWKGKTGLNGRDRMCHMKVTSCATRNESTPMIAATASRVRHNRLELRRSERRLCVLEGTLQTGGPSVRRIESTRSLNKVP